MFAQDKDSKTKPDESGWGSDEFGKWSGQSGVIGEHDKITYGGHNCPVVVVGKSVFRTDNMEKYLELQTDKRISGNHDTALGADGRYFAMSVREKVGKDSIQNIAVFDNETGKQTCLIKGVLDKHLVHLKISRNEYIVTGYYGDKAILNVHNAADGSLIKTIELTDKESLEKVLDFSSDGHYLTSVVDDQMIVYKVGSSKIVATMEHPSFSDENAEDENSSRSHSNDHVFIYAWTKGLKFSPDAEELVAFSTHGGNRLVCWNKKAKMMTHKRIRFAPGAFNDDMELQWFPSQDAWMIGGNIIDRASGKVVWAAQSPFASKTYFYVHDQDTLIGRLHAHPTKLQRIPVPWKKIKQGLAAIEQQVPAYIAPYQPVDIKIEFGKTRGNANSAEKVIQEGLIKRLASGGMKYEAGSEYYFRLRLTEAAGETLPIHEQTSRFAIFDRGRDTGRKATLAKGELVVEYFAKGEKKPMWNQVIEAESGKSYNTEINQNSIRESMLTRLKYQMSKLEFPYFIPVDESIPALPIIAK